VVDRERRALGSATRRGLGHERDARDRPAAGVHRRAVGARAASASVERQRCRRRYRVPCNSRAPAVISRTRGALLLSCTQASVAEFRRQTLAPDENSSVDRTRLLLEDAVRQRARRGRPARRLRSATLARRVVGVCDSNSGDHDGESGRPGADTRPTGHVKRLPGTTVVSAGQAQIGRSQAQIEHRIQHAGKFEIAQPSGIAGDGERRTRTADTTIFSRAAVASETGLFAGNSLASGHVYGVRVFPDLRPFPRRYGRWRGSSAFSLVDMAILTAGRGGAARRLPLAFGYEVAVLTL
jgi:hypothetical protein